MTRRDRAGCRRAPRAPLWLAGALLLALAGCTHNTLSRAQTAEEERDRYGVRTVGDVTAVGNAEPVALGGVGLVVGLEGTGGDCAADGYRAMLVHDLQKHNVRNVKEVLASPNHALVIVEASLPPGANKGDRLDLTVKLPPGSRATSLRGGYLKKCLLYNYDFARNLNPNYTGPANGLLGHPVAFAEGQVLVEVGPGDGEAGHLKQGHIWGGGRSRIDQPFGLMMAPDQQFARVSALVAERINQTFQGGLRGSVEDKIAVAKNNLAVMLRVPAQYRPNLLRYLRVVRFIPLRTDAADAPPAEGNDRRPYRQRLAADLLDPTQTVVAALRLEALGNRSTPVLQKGLLSPHPLVRFCSAEALAYLGSPTGAEELARAVVEQPLFRAFGLTALASLDESISRDKLRDLLLGPYDDQTRVGAFRALRTLDENEAVVLGELLNESFWLHRIAPDAPPLVHVSTTRRAELLLFGQAPRLKPPFWFLAGEFAVTATEDDRARCTVSRATLGGDPIRKSCGLELEAVLRTMADLGAMYPEVVALLRQAESTGSLNCRVQVDALPQAPSVYDLVQAGRDQGSVELVPAGQDLGLTPTLYEAGLPSRRNGARRAAPPREGRPE
jgi:hypothetical protein